MTLAKVLTSKNFDSCCWRSCWRMDILPIQFTTVASVIFVRHGFSLLLQISSSYSACSLHSQAMQRTEMSPWLGCMASCTYVHCIFIGGGKLFMTVGLLLLLLHHVSCLAYSMLHTRSCANIFAFANFTG